MYGNDRINSKIPESGDRYRARYRAIHQKPPAKLDWSERSRNAATAPHGRNQLSILKHNTFTGDKVRGDHCERYP